MARGHVVHRASHTAVPGTHISASQRVGAMIRRSAVRLLLLYDSCSTCVYIPVDYNCSVYILTRTSSGCVLFFLFSGRFDVSTKSKSKKSFFLDMIY